LATTLGASTSDVQFFSVSAIASRWAVSEDTVARRLEQFRGEQGFLDLGTPEDVKKHKRRYSVVRIHPTLLEKIEGQLQ
jgi:hypothetical protein